MVGEWLFETSFRKYLSSLAQHRYWSVVHLLKAVVALIVTPIDEDGSMIDTGAILAPSFKAHMSSGKGSDRRPLPGEVALGPVGAEDHGGAAVAVSIAPGFVLPRIPDIIDSDGPDEIELRSADIDVCAVLNEPEGRVGGKKVIRGFWNTPSNLNRSSVIARWKRLSRSSAIALEERFEDVVCSV